MQTRVLGLSFRAAILTAFAIFFIAPILWLVLTPTKADPARDHGQPLLVRELPSGVTGVEPPRPLQ